MDNQARAAIAFDWGFFRIKSTIYRDYGAELGPYGLAIYGALSYHADNTTGQSFAGVATLAKETGMSTNKARQCLQQLERLGLVRIQERVKENGYHLTNLYTLLQPPERGTPPREVPTPPRGVPTPHGEDELDSPNIDLPDYKEPAGKPADPGPELVSTALDVYVYRMVDEHDRVIYCPHCDAEVDVLTLSKAGAECECGQPFRVYDWMGKVIRKPRQSVRRAEQSPGPVMEGFYGRPVDAFCALIRLSPKKIVGKKRAQWGRKLQEIAEGAEAEQVVAAIKAIPKSEFDWILPSSPYSNKFAEVLQVMLLRATPAPEEQAEISENDRRLQQKLKEINAHLSDLGID